MLTYTVISRAWTPAKTNIFTLNAVGFTADALPGYGGMLFEQKYIII